VAPYSDVYGQPPDQLFVQALVQTANTLAHAADTAVRSGDPDEPYRCCPLCGSPELIWSHDSSYHIAEDVYYAVKCARCGWFHEEK
jgi:hypothetical protein